MSTTPPIGFIHSSCFMRVFHSLPSSLRVNGFLLARRYSQATQKVASLETIKNFWKCPSFVCWMFLVVYFLCATGGCGDDDSLPQGLGRFGGGESLRESFSPKNFNSLNSVWWNANSVCYEVMVAKGCLSEGLLAKIGCRYWNHMPQPSLLLEGKKFLRIKDEGRLVVDV